MTSLPRGIAPELLVSQVLNTMPYLFDDGSIAGTALERFPSATLLRRYAREGLPEALGHFEYFRLCMACHYLTVATPVPTDVDNQIRQKLWPAALPLETALEMSALVLESLGWDFRAVSRRYAEGAPGSPQGGSILSGHYGEWFTIAAGAYCALGQYGDAPEARARRAQLLEAIAGEVDRHSEFFGSLWRAKLGVESLKAAAAVAHNLGDLDRVMDMWELDVADPLRLRFYKLGSHPFDAERKLRYLGRLWVAGELYKSPIGGSAMALENHRHFALRKPKCLRRSPELLIPTGPFFHDWGRTVARALATPDGRPTDDTLEVVEALRHGWERMPKTMGYPAALRGMREVHEGLEIERGGSPQPLARQALKQSKESFERTWGDEALRLMEDIPSRA